MLDRPPPKAEGQELLARQDSVLPRGQLPRLLAPRIGFSTHPGVSRIGYARTLPFTPPAIALFPRRAPDPACDSRRTRRGLLGGHRRSAGLRRAPSRCG